MKKFLLSLFVALIAISSVQAQQISVVSPGGATTLHRTFQEAINGADPGSIIYLPGGGFNLPDSVKINKKLTIIGIGHYVKSGNVDGVTTISGNLWFNEGSSGSAVMGCYITGNVNIGDGGASVNDVLIRYCNLNSVQVKNYKCLDILVNQNFIRNTSSFNGANSKITNNVIHSIYQVDNGVIMNNIITDRCGGLSYGAIHADNTNISYNVMFIGPDGGYNWSNGNVRGSGNTGTDNIAYINFGENCINVDGISWSTIFKNNAGITPASDFHFTEDYSQYENQVGIYAGTGFNDLQMAPVPYIVAKHVDEQTDASGKLIVKIRVKANQ